MTSLMKKISSLLALLALLALSNNIFAARSGPEDDEALSDRAGGGGGDPSAGEGASAGESDGAARPNFLRRFFGGLAGGTKGTLNWTSEAPCNLLELVGKVLSYIPGAGKVSGAAVWTSNAILLTELLAHMRVLHITPAVEGAEAVPRTVRVNPSFHYYKKAITGLLVLAGIYYYFRSNAKVAIKASKLADPDTELGQLGQERQDLLSKAEKIQSRIVSGETVSENEMLELGALLSDSLPGLEQEIRRVYQKHTTVLGRVKSAFIGLSSYDEEEEEEVDDDDDE